MLCCVTKLQPAISRRDEARRLTVIRRASARASVKAHQYCIAKLSSGCSAFFRIMLKCLQEEDIYGGLLARQYGGKRMEGCITVDYLDDSRCLKDY